LKTPIQLSAFVVLLLLNTVVLFGKNNDSLIQCLASTTGVERFQTYTDIATGYLLTDPEKAINYSQKGLKEASDAGNLYYKATFLGILGYANYIRSDAEKAIDYTKQSIRYFKKTDSLIPLSKAYSTLGSIYHKTGNFNEALKYMNLALNIHQEQYNKKGIALSHLNIGVIYHSKGDYTLAINYFLKALNYYDEMPHNRNYYLLLMNTGILYKQIEEYDKSLSYLLRCMQNIKQSNNKRDLAACYLNLGITYKNLDSLNKAKTCYQKAEVIAKKLNNKTLSGKIYNNLGVIELQKNYLQLAIKYFEQSLAVKKQYNDSLGLTVTYNYLADAYNKADNYKLALEYLKKAGQISEKKQFKSRLAETYRIYVEVYKKMKNFEKAFYYQSKEFKLKDEIFNSKKFKQITELQTKYETHKKEQEIQILNQQNAIKDLKLKKGQYTKVILAGIVLFLVIISIIGYKRFIEKKRANRLLNKQKKQLDDYNEELTTANENLHILNNNLEELNNTKDKFFSIISHDLKNPLGVLYATTDVLTRHFNSFSAEKTKTYLENMNRSSKHLKSLLDNLLEWSQIQTGKITIIKTKFDLNEVIKNTLLVAAECASTKNIILRSAINQEIFVYADSDMIATVIRNLVSNAVKFTPRGGEIIIHLTEESNKIIVHISDTGVGIPDDKLPGLFKINTTYKQSGTEDEKGTGLGLILCKEFVEKNDGEIWVTSKIGKGSTFSFSLKRK